MAWTEKYANFDLATGLNDGSSEANAYQTPTDMIAGMADGVRMNIKKTASPYTSSGAGVLNYNMANSGTQSDPRMIRGYETTIGDDGIFEWVSDYNSQAIWWAESHGIVMNVKHTPSNSSNTTTAIVGDNDDNAYAINCHMEGGGTNGNCDVVNAINSYFGVDGTGHIEIGGVNGASSSFYGCTFERIGGTPAQDTLVDADSYGKSQAFQKCIFIGDGSAENGLEIRRAGNARFLHLSDCIFYDFGDDGFKIDAQPSTPSNYLNFIVNNLFVECGGYGMNILGTMVNAMLRRNAHYNCTSGLTNVTNDQFQLGDNVALSADPFEDAANKDFRINDAATGGALLRAQQMLLDPADSGSMPFYDWGWLREPAAGGGGGGTRGYIG